MPEQDWWRHSVVYQVYPRSFGDSNDDGVGDLPGITARLDYLNDGTPDSLGIDAVWLSPFYPSPQVDYGYDVADYCSVDPAYGTLADFDRLVAEAHRRGVRVLIDLVPNHTSDQHPWFVESRASRDSAKRDWYVWAESRSDGGPPNNWLSCFAATGPAWTLDERTGQYYLHSYTSSQPDLNWWNAEVRTAIESVMRFWLERGVDGFRIDAAHRLAKDRQLRDNPPAVASARLHVAHPTERQRNLDWPEVHAILRRFRRLLDEYGNHVAVGEVVVTDPQRWLRYFGSAADELQLLFNFDLLAQPWRADAVQAAVDRHEALLPSHAWPAYTLGNHDVARLASRYGADGARLAAMLLLTLRGTPFLYYGDEIGMTDGTILAAQARDPDGRDPQRTPMQWALGHAASFTAGQPWLPVGPDALACNVEVQKPDPNSLLSLYRRLLWLRRGSPELRAGGYRPLAGAPPELFAYLREAGAERVLVALNFADRPQRLCAAELGSIGRQLVSTASTEVRQVDLRAVEVDAREGVVVKVVARAA